MRHEQVHGLIGFHAGAGVQHLDRHTGINAEGEGKWSARDARGTKRRLWREIHLSVG